MTNLLPLREIAISYAGYGVGGDQTAHVLNEIMIIENDYEKGVLEFVFTIEQDTEALFAADCAAAEAAFRKPRQNTLVTLGGQTLVSWSQSSNTGMNAFPRIVKWGAKGDSARARWYRIRIECQLPADNIGTSGRRYSFVNVAYTPARRRTVTISATYTALTTNSARAQYQAVFDAYATSVLSTLGGTYKKLEEPEGRADDANKLGDFSDTYEEIIWTRGLAGDASIRGETFSITRTKVSPGDSPDGSTVIERLVTLNGIYTAFVDWTTSTDLLAKFAAIRPKLAAEAQIYLGGGTVIVTEESPTFDPVDNKLTVHMTFMGATSKGIVEYTLTNEDFIVEGNVLVPVLSGVAMMKYKYQGPGTWQRVITQNFLTFGAQPTLVSNLLTPDPPNGMKKSHQSFRESVTPETRGIGGTTFNLKRFTRVYTYEYYIPPPSAPVDNSVPTTRVSGTGSTVPRDSEGNQIANIPT